MTLLNLHSEPLKPEWRDIYGHMNEAYYLVVFSNATFALQDHFAIGDEYFERTGGSMYTVESHIRYLEEVRGEAVMEVESLILGADAKRLRVGHVMKVDGTERATFECMLLHFDSRSGRVAAMPDDVVRRLRAAVPARLPEWAGRAVKDIRG